MWIFLVVFIVEVVLLCVSCVKRNNAVSEYEACRVRFHALKQDGVSGSEIAVVRSEMEGLRSKMGSCQRHVRVYRKALIITVVIFILIIVLFVAGWFLFAAYLNEHGVMNTLQDIMEWTGGKDHASPSVIEQLENGTYIPSVLVMLSDMF